MPSKQTYEQNAYYHPKYRGFNGIKVPVHFRVRNTVAKILSLLRLIHVGLLKKVAKIDFFKVGKRLCQSREKNVRG